MNGLTVRCTFPSLILESAAWFGRCQDLPMGEVLLVALLCFPFCWSQSIAWPRFWLRAVLGFFYFPGDRIEVRFDIIFATLERTILDF